MSTESTKSTPPTEKPYLVRMTVRNGEDKDLDIEACFGEGIKIDDFATIIQTAVAGMAEAAAKIIAIRCGMSEEKALKLLLS